MAKPNAYVEWSYLQLAVAIWPTLVTLEVTVKLNSVVLKSNVIDKTPFL